jgi:hypothetical protein
VQMLNMAMMSREARRRAHVVELNEPVLEEDSIIDSDIAK